MKVGHKFSSPFPPSSSPLVGVEIDGKRRDKEEGLLIGNNPISPSAFFSSLPYGDPFSQCSVFVERDIV